MVYLVVSGMDVLGLFEFENVRDRDLVKVNGHWHRVSSKSKAVTEYNSTIEVLSVSGALRRVDSEDVKS